MNVKNRTLFIADNLPIMRGIDSDCIDLIYLDPPFNTKKTYKAPIGSPAEGAEFKDIWTDEDVKDEWYGQVAEQNDHLYQIIQASEHVYDKSMKIYLMAMTVRLFEMHRILKDTGSIYLHCDPTASHYLKLVMDSVFGKQNFRNEIVWCYPPGGKGPNFGFHNKHDIILFFSKSERNANFNRPYTELSDNAKSKFNKIDEAGRYYKEYPGGRSYLDESPGRAVPSWWTDINSLGQTQSKERTGYPTQKPLALLNRIIKASSNENDVVLDPFCGCATACVSAEHLNRKWIGIDISPSAEIITKLRLDDASRQGELLSPIKMSDVHVLTEPPTRSDVPDPTQLRLPSAHTHKHELYGEQEGKCNGCLLLFPFRNMTIDHIIPRAEHGTDHRDNLQLLCNACNSSKGSLSQDAFLDKLKSQGIR